MQRQLDQLTSKEFEILVIGGGIYGACVAWDASLRGLSVALVEKGDFGHATSANSLKTVHGGLRYLKDGDPRLIRRMIRERMTWMRIAPHLVHPLPCMLPTYQTGKLLTRKSAMRAALTITDLLGYDRNQLTDPEKHLPSGQILSRDECLRLLPGLDPVGVTGAALWYDAQIHNTERLLLAVILAAVQAGAVVANYVEVTGFLSSPARIHGVRVVDRLTGEPFAIQAKIVVNCAGAWAGDLLKLAQGRLLRPDVHLSAAANLVTRQIIAGAAVGLPSDVTVTRTDGRPRRSTRQLFVTPWRQFSLLGTLHVPLEEGPDSRPSEQLPTALIEHFLEEINAAYPDASLTLDDVCHTHYGYLPAKSAEKTRGEITLVRESSIYDHARLDGLRGLITVVGVKYTTARWTAEQVVDLVVQQLGRKADHCRTAHHPVHGGQLDQFDRYLAQAQAQASPLITADVVRHLVYTYGSEHATLLASIQTHPDWARPIAESSCTTVAEVMHALRHEMTVHLADVVMRRTEIGAAGLPEEYTVRQCAEIMACACRWSDEQRASEIQALHAAYPFHQDLRTL